MDRRILAIAVPAMLTAAAEPLYDLTDTAILGRLGSAQLGGAALATSALGLGNAVFIFLMFGTTASVARLIGAGASDDASHRGVQALWLGLGLGVFSALVLWPLARPLLVLLGGRGQVLHHAVTYFTVSLWGLPAFLLVMAGAGYLRGTENTRTPLWIALSSVMFNLVAELVLIIGLGFGVAASAGTTVVAKWIAATIYLWLVTRDARRRRQPLRPDPDVLADLGRTGGPLFVRTAALRLALAGAYAAAARQGTEELAAWAIALQVWAFLAYVTDGLEVAGQALVGGALGARDPDRAREVGRRILTLALGVGVGLGTVVLLTHRWIPSVFSSDARVVALATTVMIWVALSQPLNAVTFALDGILVGAQDLRFLAVAMTIAVAAFAPAAWWIGRSQAGLGWLFAAWTGFMVMRAGWLGARFTGREWARNG